MAAVEKLKKKTERSELSPKDSNAMAERLQVAEETISILNAANNQLNEELCALRSDFAVLEGLLIESGQTLERLQEMVSNLRSDLFDVNSSASHFS